VRPEIVCSRRRRTGTEDRSLEQGVGCQTVGPMQPGTADLPSRKQPLNQGPPVSVHPHSPTEVVGGGNHRHGALGHVDPELQQPGVDPRKTVPNKVGVEVGKVEVNEVQSIL
jgi:hypothetical protein